METENITSDSQNTEISS